MDIQNIAVEQLRPHPKNPRLVMREDVIAGIVAGLSGGFHPAHALQVWPAEDGFTILSGHHRVEAASRSGLAEVPCWVRDDLTEDEAFMFLVTDNNQGELSPLEIGLHALEYVEKDKRGMGANGGGLKGYAESVGKPQSRISEYRQAADVFKSINSNVGINDADNKSRLELMDKANHLVAIHKAPAPLWPILVSALLAKEWSVKDTKHFVGKVLEFAVPEKWQAVFLPLPTIISRYLERLEFSPSTVNALIGEAEKIEQRIATYNVDNDAFIEKFHAWLSEGVNDYAWDVRKIIAYGRELQASLEAEERKASEMWMLGDWREHVGKLQDGSVALLLTDPPYGMDFQSDRRTDRREDRKNDPIANDGIGVGPEETKAAILAMMPKLADDAHTFIFCHWSNEQQIRDMAESCGLKVRGSLIWVKNNRGMGDPKTTFAPRHERIIHAVKGSPVLFSRPDDVLFADKCNSDKHPTEKPVALLSQLIEATTTKGELVADPFGGVASTLAAAKELGRKFWGCELNEQYYLHGEVRLK